MQRRVIEAAVDKVVRVGRIMADVSVIRHHIVRAGGDGHGSREIHLLPAGGTFSAERGLGKQLAVGGPQTAYVRAGVGAGFEEPNTIDHTVDVGIELDAEFNGPGVGVSVIDWCRGRRPDRAWAGAWGNGNRYRA